MKEKRIVILVFESTSTTALEPWSFLSFFVSCEPRPPKSHEEEIAFANSCY
jgi:hypothetical protein